MFRNTSVLRGPGAKRRVPVLRSHTPCVSEGLRVSRLERYEQEDTGRMLDSRQAQVIAAEIRAWRRRFQEIEVIAPSVLAITSKAP